MGTTDEPNHCGFTNTWWTNKQQRVPILDKVTQQIGASSNRSTNTACQANDFAFPVPYGADPVQCPADSSSIIISKLTNLRKTHGV